MNWKKVASVTTGGKAYFHVAFTENPHTKYSIVWHRFDQKYVLQVNDILTIAESNSVNKLKRMVK